MGFLLLHLLQPGLRLLEILWHEWIATGEHKVKDDSDAPDVVFARDLEVRFKRILLEIDHVLLWRRGVGSAFELAQLQTFVSFLQVAEVYQLHSHLVLTDVLEVVVRELAFNRVAVSLLWETVEVEHDVLRL